MALAWVREELHQQATSGAGVAGRVAVRCGAGGGRLARDGSGSGSGSEQSRWPEARFQAERGREIELD